MQVLRVKKTKTSPLGSKWPESLESHKPLTHPDDLHNLYVTKKTLKTSKKVTAATEDKTRKGVLYKYESFQFLKGSHFYPLLSIKSIYFELPSWGEWYGLRLVTNNNITFIWSRHLASWHKRQWISHISNKYCIRARRKPPLAKKTIFL